MSYVDDISGRGRWRVGLDLSVWCVWGAFWACFLGLVGECEYCLYGVVVPSNLCVLHQTPYAKQFEGSTMVGHLVDRKLLISGSGGGKQDFLLVSKSV